MEIAREPGRGCVYSYRMHIHGGSIRHICPHCATRRLTRGARLMRPVESCAGRWMHLLTRYAASGSLLEVATVPTGLMRWATRCGWQAAMAPPTLREGMWRAGSFDAVMLCGLLHTVSDPDTLLRLAAHYCRLDGMLLAEMPTVERTDTLQTLTGRLSRQGFRVCWHGCLPAHDGRDDVLQLTVLARYVP